MRDTSDLYAWGGEDYDVHWDYTDFKNKTILDLGAEFGSTAAYFLKMGAKKVICVDQDYGYTQALRWIFRDDNRVVSLNPQRIETGNHFETLIKENPCDICKMDIEGSELTFVDCDAEVVKTVPEYIIECHNNSVGGMGTKIMNEKITSFLEGLGYEVEYCVEITGEEVIQAGSVDVIHARRK